MPNITYEKNERSTKLSVLVDGRVTGHIKIDMRAPGGAAYRYYPKATGRSGRPGAPFLSLDALKKSLEG